MPGCSLPAAPRQIKGIARDAAFGIFAAVCWNGRQCVVENYKDSGSRLKGEGFREPDKRCPTRVAGTQPGVLDTFRAGSESG